MCALLKMFQMFIIICLVFKKYSEHSKIHIQKKVQVQILFRVSKILHDFQKFCQGFQKFSVIFKCSIYFLGLPQGCCFLNSFIQNYSQLEHIFSYELTTDKHAIGSSEPLGSPMSEYLGTQESKTITIDGQKAADHVPILDRKSRRCGLMDKEPSIFRSMIETIKEVLPSAKASLSMSIHHCTTIPWKKMASVTRI